MLFSFLGGEVGGGGQAEGEELFLFGELVPGLHAWQHAAGAVFVYVKTLHPVFALRPFQYNILGVSFEILFLSKTRFLPPEPVFRDAARPIR